MTDQTPIIEALKRLSHRADEKGRVVSSDDPGSLRKLLLAEIEATVLPRELTFHNDQGESISLDVVNRKILRITKVEPRHMMTIDGLIDVTLTSGDRNSASALIDLMERFVLKTQRIEIGSNYIDHSMEIGKTGIDAAILSAQPAKVSGKPKSAALPGSIEDFASKVTLKTIGWIVVKDGIIVGKHGPSDVVEKLQNYFDAEAQAMYTMHRRNYPDTRDTGFAIRSQMTETGESFVYGWDISGGILALVPSSNIQKITHAWIAR